jgi:putative ABC transport system permease protein
MMDLRLAARALLRAPAFSLVAVLSLALGFALTASIVAIVNAYLIRSLPFPQSDRLYHVNYAPVGEAEPGGLSGFDWTALRDVVEQADASAPTRYFVGEGAERNESMGLMVAPGTIEMLGLHVAQGRSLVEEDFAPESEQVVLIGQALWRQRFGGDPNIIGRPFRATPAAGQQTETFRIIGIVAPGFRYARDYNRGEMEFVIPLRRTMRAYMVRLRPGVALATAEQRINDAVRRVATTIPPNWTGVRLESLRDRYVSGLRPMLTAITVTAGLVLVIVCINVAVLVLLRALRRQKELAVRVALGAGRGRIIRVLAGEAFLLCASALALGLALTAFTMRLLEPLIEERLGREAPGAQSAIALDFPVVLVIGGAAVVIALLFSFIPLATPWARRLSETLRRGSSTGLEVPATRRLRTTLIAFEVAASFALLVGCGLMIRSVVNLVRTDLGFQTERIVRARIALPATNYPDSTTFLRFYDAFTTRLAGAGTRFGLADIIPFFQAPKRDLHFDGGTQRAGVIAATAEYFDLLGIPVVHGRGFSSTDRAGAEPVALVSETLARRLWPNSSPIGQRVSVTDNRVAAQPTVWRTVVGVVGDTRQTFTDSDQSDLYLSFYQAPSRYAPVYVEADPASTEWLTALRTAAADIDPDVLITGRITGNASLDEEADRHLAGPRFLMSVLTGFAVFALIVAIVGIYGVTAYAVQQRERELAIRMAIGATRQAVIGMFLRDGTLLLFSGITGGLLGAIAVSRVLANQLHGVDRFDPSTLLAAALFLAAAVLLATWSPARRATLRSPMAVLKEN